MDISILHDMKWQPHNFLWLAAGDPGVEGGSCPHRKESKPLNSRSASLFLQNYFPTDPVEADSCKEHSVPLVDMVNTCYKAAGNVLPNFLAVNFYMVFLILLCCLFQFNNTENSSHIQFRILNEISCRGVMVVVFLISWIKWMAIHCVAVIQSLLARFACISCPDMYCLDAICFLNFFFILIISYFIRLVFLVSRNLI